MKQTRELFRTTLSKTLTFVTSCRKQTSYMCRYSLSSRFTQGHRESRVSTNFRTHCACRFKHGKMSFLKHFKVCSNPIKNQLPYIHRSVTWSSRQMWPSRRSRSIIPKTWWCLLGFHNITPFGGICKNGKHSYNYGRMPRASKSLIGSPPCWHIDVECAHIEFAY